MDRLNKPGSFRGDTRGLSAVLATTMLIAVVVLLGVAVTLMIGILISEQPEDAPKIAWAESEEDDRWIIAQAPAEIPWNAYQMRITNEVGHVMVKLNGEAGVEGGMRLQTDPHVLEFPGDVAGGQYLDFCSDQDETNMIIRLVHIDSQTVAHKFQFDVITGDPLCVTTI